MLNEQNFNLFRDKRDAYIGMLPASIEKELQLNMRKKSEFLNLDFKF